MHYVPNRDRSTKFEGENKILLANFGMPEKHSKPQRATQSKEGPLIQRKDSKNIFCARVNLTVWPHWNANEARNTKILYHGYSAEHISPNTAYLWHKIPQQ